MRINLSQVHKTDPEATFAAAEGHLLSSRLISSQMNAVKNRALFTYIIPIVPSALALEFLAAELYLHCLRSLQGLDRTPESHLGLLFDELGEDTKTRLERHYRSIMSKSNLATHVKKDTKQPIPKISTFLHESGHGFNAWTYWSEELGENGKPNGPGSLGLGEITMAFRTEILDMNPEWARHTLLDKPHRRAA